MIKEEELRIGNWISNVEVFKQVDIDFLVVIHHNDLEVYGITLTPDILEKAGFQRRWEGRWSKDLVDICQTRENDISSGFILLNGEEQSAWDNVYFYLHQIQNLYFALTGEELEINL